MLRTANLLSPISGFTYRLNPEITFSIGYMLHGSLVLP